MTLMDKMGQAFYREVNKHGQYCGFVEFSAYVNSLTPYALLEEISHHLGELE